MLTLPGYFRPTKLWDLLVINEGRLIAALEFKSQVGPSFGNNFNNRSEEAIGTAHDLWTAYREGAFGEQTRPFVGWLMLLEDAPALRAPVRDASPHFPVFEEFQGASYAERYNILCRKLVQERLYTTASILTSPRSFSADSAYAELSDMTGLRTFVTELAGHVADSKQSPLSFGAFTRSTENNFQRLCERMIRQDEFESRKPKEWIRSSKSG